jgi:hypothetical protein
MPNQTSLRRPIVPGNPEFGTGQAIRWTAEHRSDVLRWLQDRGLQAPPELANAYQLLRHGLANESAIRAAARNNPAERTRAALDRIIGDVLEHANARAMVACRAPLLLSRLDVLLCPVYADAHRELLLPTWLTIEAMVTLFPPNDHFVLGRTASAVWVVLEAPVVSERDGGFAKFANFFQRQGGAGDTTWHWRGTQHPMPGHDTAGATCGENLRAGERGCADAPADAWGRRPCGPGP